LLQAAVAGLVAGGVGLAWAALIIGGVALLIGIILVAIGINWLKAARPVPARTIGQWEQDAEIVKQQVGS
jgi:putative superfamily III holin-X